MQTEEGLSAQVHLFESAFAGIMWALPGHQPSQADDRRPGLSLAAVHVRLMPHKKELQLHISHKNNNDQREQKA